VPLLIRNFLFSKPSGEDLVLADFLKHARKFPKKVGRLRVVNSSNLDPVKNENFLLIAWFLINNRPKEGERIVLLNKSDQKSKFASGYAVALEFHNNSFIPFVYWKDTLGQGRWYRFSEAQILPKVWFMLALSFKDDRDLGLHVASLHTLLEDKIQLLGGYSFKDNLFPHSDSDLFLGGKGKYAFHGFLGPVGVFSGKDLTFEYRKLYGKLFVKPDVFPKEFKKAVKFWTIDGEKDLSSFQREIKRELTINGQLRAAKKLEK